jgi:hypothetical protein
MNYPNFKPRASRINDPKNLRFAPAGHSSPSLKARRVLTATKEAHKSSWGLNIGTFLKLFLHNILQKVRG